LFVLGVAGVALLLSIDLLSVLARFLIEHEAGVGTVLRLLAAKTPWFLHLGVPVAATFAVLVAGGRMARDSELKAAQAGGIAPRALILPLALWGVVVSLGAVVVNGQIEPRAERAYQRIIESFLYGRPPLASERDVSYRVGDTIFHAARVRATPEDPRSASLDGILVRLADGTLWTAREGVWDADEGVWTLREGWTLPPQGDPAPAQARSLPFPLELDPAASLAREDTLTLAELSRQLAERSGAGAAASELRFELHRRLADAASAAVFVLVAAALALRLRGRAAGIAWTIVLVAGFWATWTFSATLFEREVLGAVAAAWATPALVGLVGVALALRSDGA
jgi:lipopolysaccharide export LptBFGC system permease protein LptF